MCVSQLSRFPGLVQAITRTRVDLQLRSPCDLQKGNKSFKWIGFANVVCKLLLAENMWGFMHHSVRTCVKLLCAVFHSDVYQFSLLPLILFIIDLANISDVITPSSLIFVLYSFPAKPLMILWNYGYRNDECKGPVSIKHRKQFVVKAELR